MIIQNDFDITMLPPCNNDNPLLPDFDWEMDAEQTIDALAGIKPDWLIVDHYALDAKWESRLKHYSLHIMAIDDLANRPHECEILMDQNWFGESSDFRYDLLVSPTCIKLLGPRYAILESEYSHLHATIPSRDGKIRRVLVFLGGSDSQNQTAKVLRALLSLYRFHLMVDVVIGANHPAPTEIMQLTSQLLNASFYQNIPSLAELMTQADLMIGAGGTTTWERICLDLPSIVISIAPNQIAMSKALHHAGYIHYLGESESVSTQDIAQAIELFLNDPDHAHNKSINRTNLVDGNGASLLANILCTWGNT